MKSDAIYFENLNSIRFIAALLVIIHHIEQIKSLFGFDNYWNNATVVLIGKLGVVIFFVLSGFLISYLLFTEQKITQSIDIKAFYIRRILRIWPLYFILIFLAFFVLQHFADFRIPGFDQNTIWNPFPANFLLFVFMLPNLASVLFGSIPFASVAWSIGAEEQFYIIWPYLTKRIKSKWLLTIGFVFLYLAVQYVCLNVLRSNIYREKLNDFIATTPMSCMAIGGVFAALAISVNPIAKRIQNILFSKILQWVILLGTVFLVAIAYKFQYYHYNEWYSILFGLLIFNFASNPNRIFSMEFKWMKYLGKISYGLYMIHCIVIVFVLNLAVKFGIGSNIILYFLILSLTILLSGLSYNFVEKRFLKWKDKFTIVKSG